MKEQIDALFLTGGEDIDPSYYGQDPHVHLGKIAPRLDAMEHALVRKNARIRQTIYGVFAVYTC